MNTKNNVEASRLFSNRTILIVWLISVMVCDFWMLPTPVLANEADLISNIREDMSEKYDQIKITQNIKNTLPQNEDKKVARVTVKYPVTAYSSEVAQCDSSPCITANGFNLCKHGIEDTVATNYLPMGTAIRIPELFGDRVFIVRDRMNARYDKHFDIWMKDIKDAKSFGLKLAKVEILN